MNRLHRKIYRLALLFLLIAAGPGWAVDYSAEIAVGDTEITFHVLVVFGGIFFAVVVFIGLLMLYYRIGLPFMAFLIRVALPILFIGVIGMCVFAFVGWLAGQRLAVTQILSLIGGLLALGWGARLFGQKNQESGPVRLSDFM